MMRNGESSWVTVLATNYELLPDLPVQLAPAVPFFDVPTLVPLLMDLHPSWKFEDLQEFMEEKTRRPVHPEDQITLNAVYQRCLRLRTEFESDWSTD